MRILKGPLNIHFMKHRLFAAIFSGILLIASIGSLAVNGLQLGLDFTGGYLIEAGYSEKVDLSKLRKELQQAGIKDAVVQYFGTSSDVTVRLPNQEGMEAKDVGPAVFEVLKSVGEKVELRRSEQVGESMGEEFVQNGYLALLVALVCIMLYVTVRFEWKFALGSVAALAHDVTITVGLFSLLKLDFDQTVLAALLAVIGYSLNDTIVVFDRVRENFLTIRKGDSIDVINTSLNQTISRTLVTSLTTLLVLVALFVFGGALIHGFATALIIGVVIGTYSSIYVASTTALALGVQREDLMPPQVDKEGADQEPLM